MLHIKCCPYKQAPLTPMVGSISQNSFFCERFKGQYIHFVSSDGSHVAYQLNWNVGHVHTMVIFTMDGLGCCASLNLVGDSCNRTCPCFICCMPNCLSVCLSTVYFYFFSIFIYFICCLPNCLSVCISISFGLFLTFFFIFIYFIFSLPICLSVSWLFFHNLNYNSQGFGNTMSELSDQVPFHSRQSRNNYQLVN